RRATDVSRRLVGRTDACVRETRETARDASPRPQEAATRGPDGSVYWRRQLAETPPGHRWRSTRDRSAPPIRRGCRAEEITQPLARGDADRCCRAPSESPRPDLRSVRGP